MGNTFLLGAEGSPFPCGSGERTARQAEAGPLRHNNQSESVPPPVRTRDPSLAEKKLIILNGFGFGFLQTFCEIHPKKVYTFPPQPICASFKFIYWKSRLDRRLRRCSCDCFDAGGVGWVGLQCCAVVLRPAM